jgi:hypothetical protein
MFIDRVQLNGPIAAEQDTYPKLAGLSSGERVSCWGKFRDFVRESPHDGLLFGNVLV